MTAEYTNVSDFVVYKLRQLIKQFNKAQRPDIAKVLADALEKYIRGEHELTFVDGWPHIIKDTVNNAENIKKTEQD